MKKKIVNSKLVILVAIIWGYVSFRLVASSTTDKDASHDDSGDLTTLDLPDRIGFRYNATYRNLFMPIQKDESDIITAPIVNQNPVVTDKQSKANFKLLGTLINNEESVAILNNGEQTIYLAAGDSMGSGIVSNIFLDSIHVTTGDNHKTYQLNSRN